ncbi:MAG: DnaB-like helicase N-terminal domain-containing protein, partial [Desulfosarcinaceae bacterium]
MAANPQKPSQDPSLQKLPPQSIEAEESILSTILLDNSTLLDVLEILSPEDFYRTAHQKIFSAVADLFAKAEPVDLVTLTNLLRDNDQLEEIGGAAYLARLVDSVPSAINIQHYARIVRDKSSLRRLIARANEITRQCYEGGGDLDEVIDFAEGAIFEISENKNRTAFHPLNKIIESNIDALEERQG